MYIEIKNIILINTKKLYYINFFILYIILKISKYHKICYI